MIAPNIDGYHPGSYWCRRHGRWQGRCASKAKTKTGCGDVRLGQTE